MDQSILELTILTFLAGGAIPVGGFLASIERIRPNWLEAELRHTLIAFGGGALLSAVALVLVPEGIKAHTPQTVAVLMLAGGVTFMTLDIYMARHVSPAAQLIAMLSDFIPEAVALGATFSTGAKTAPLLAILIAIQNLPEGFNAYREIVDQKNTNRRVVLNSFVALACLGPIAGLCGHFLLAEHQQFVGGLMLFAAGGILYLTFQDVAPQAKLEQHWGPPVGAVAGFTLGVLGEMLVR